MNFFNMASEQFRISGFGAHCTVFVVQLAGTVMLKVRNINVNSHFLLITLECDKRQRTLSKTFLD